MKSIIIIMLLIVNTSFVSVAQLDQELKESILDEIENRLPKLINEEQGKFKIVEIQKLDIGKRRSKLKGILNVEILSQQIFSDDIRIKVKVMHKPNDQLSVKQFKIHLPGNKFLWFRKYDNLINRE